MLERQYTWNDKIQGRGIDGYAIEPQVRGSYIEKQAEDLSSNIPKIWRDQNLLRILTKRGKGTVPTMSKREDTLNLCLPCPGHITLRLGRVRCLCGG